MDPVSWGAAGLAATVLGGATSAFGDISGGNSSKSMYDYKAGMALTNAQIATQNADYTRDQGEKSALYSGIKGAQTSGAIIVRQAGNGLEVNSGTNVNVQQGQQWANLQDQKNIRDTSTRKAYGYDVEASNKTQEANLDVMAGENAQKAGYIKAAGSILGTASSVATKWSQGNTLGIWGDNSNQGIDKYGPDFTVTGYQRT